MMQDKVVQAVQANLKNIHAIQLASAVQKVAILAFLALLVKFGGAFPAAGTRAMLFKTK